MLTSSKFRMQLDMVKDAVDIDQLLVLLGFTIKIRNNRELRGPCIIHGGDNKTAFRIRRDSKRWVCYTHHCEEKIQGTKQDDVVGLVMATKKISFSESVKFLSNLTGIPVNGNVNEQEYARYRREKDKKDFIDMSNKLKDVKLPIIFSESWVNKANRHRTNYFLSKGFKRETLDFFKVGGYIKDDYGIEREFIPVWDEYGRLVGGQGRRTDNNEDPKYITKGEFEKSKVLYNLNNAKNYLGDLNPTIIVVEGVTDVWSLYEECYLNCVTTFGTGISENQVHLLMKYAINLIILFDGDEAGREAARKLEKMSKGLNTYIILLPESTDPFSCDKVFLNNELNRAYKQLGAI